MSEIIEKILSEIGCSFLSGYAFKSSDYSDKGIPLIKIGNIQNRIVTVDINGDSVSELLISDKTKKFLLNDGDILIAMTGQGSVGRVGKLKLQDGENAFLNQRVGKFLCDERNINIEYLYYILASERFQDYLFNTGAGSGQPNLSPELILRTEIPWVEYSEQTAIASILSSLDDKIDLLHRQNQTLEKMAETLFRQWFVEEAKEEWEVGSMEHFASFYNGKTRPKALGNIPVYGGNGILDYTNDFNYDGQSIIIGRVGAYCGSLYFEDGKIWVSDNALAVKSRIENSIYFLFYLFKSLDLNSMAEGSSHPLLTQTLLKSIEIIIPPLEKIRSFNLQVITLHNKMDGNNSQIRILTSMQCR